MEDFNLSKLGTVALFVIALVLLLAALPANVGCNAGPDAPVIARLWAATCEGGQP